MTNRVEAQLNYLALEYGEFFIYASEEKDKHEALWAYTRIYESITTALVAIRDISSKLVLEAVEKQIKKELVELNYIKGCFENDYVAYLEANTILIAVEVKTETFTSSGGYIETEFRASEVIEKLEACESLEEADEYLNELYLKKSHYQALIGYCNITWISKNASKGELRKRLVDNCVGARLRANVIKNVNVSLGSRNRKQEAV